MGDLSLYMNDGTYYHITLSDDDMCSLLDKLMFKDCKYIHITDEDCEKLYFYKRDQKGRYEGYYTKRAVINLRQITSIREY